jgi:hypothetical protein
VALPVWGKDCFDVLRYQQPLPLEPVWPVYVLINNELFLLNK